MIINENTDSVISGYASEHAISIIGFKETINILEKKIRSNNLIFSEKMFKSYYYLPQKEAIAKLSKILDYLLKLYISSDYNSDKRLAVGNIYYISRTLIDIGQKSSLPMILSYLKNPLFSKIAYLICVSIEVLKISNKDEIIKELFESK